MPCSRAGERERRLAVEALAGAGSASNARHARRNGVRYPKLGDQGMDGWTLAIYVVVAYLALSSLVVLMRRHRNSYEARLPRPAKRRQQKGQAPAAPIDVAATPAEATPSNGEGSS